MTETTALLSLVQWMSPAFPTGAFAYSHGLEHTIGAGELASEAQLTQWLSDVLTYGAGWSDAVLLACGLRGDDLDALGQIARALAPSAERLSETMQQGEAFQKARAAMLGTDLGPPLALPLAVAQGARELDLTAAQIIAVYLHGFASNLTSAAVRFVPLGQAQGQRALAAQHERIADIAARAAVAQTEDITQSAFRADMAAMLHETMDVRLFKT
ncbi:urease accessory protein UreF [Thioclava sp. SK-1]|uniref:urease accessory protein UreF n=1 Tax=Thioclava sp. SK-1 TaxID=1889770 RepID=UPI000825CED2|nr:urease accessory UreF family protein [Thioclava sp. SK-1]OCX60922.1 urease accessory protein UreF [Thioclava sp. SK-1]